MCDTSSVHGIAAPLYALALTLDDYMPGFAAKFAANAQALHNDGLPTADRWEVGLNALRGVGEIHRSVEIAKSQKQWIPEHYLED